MANEFEPYTVEGKSSEFNIWDHHSIRNDIPQPLTPEQELANECERLRQEAIAQGYAEGMHKAQTEINEKKAELAFWLDLLQKPIKLVDEQLIQEMLQTIIWLCQHCIGVELSVNPDKLRGLLQRVKDELPVLQGNKKLAMHSQDVEWLQTEFTEKEFVGLHSVLISDNSLNRGDFYLKDEQSELDGRILTRFMTMFAKYINKDNLTLPMDEQDNNE